MTDTCKNCKHYIPKIGGCNIDGEPEDIDTNRDGDIVWCKHKIERVRGDKR